MPKQCTIYRAIVWYHFDLARPSASLVICEKHIYIHRYLHDPGLFSIDYRTPASRLRRSVSVCIMRFSLFVVIYTGIIDPPAHCVVGSYGIIDSAYHLDVGSSEIIDPTLCKALGSNRIIDLPLGSMRMSGCDTPTFCRLH